MRSDLRAAWLGLALAAGPSAAAETKLVEVASPGWTEELREDLRAGLAALPEAARAFPGGPLEIELDDEEAPWGIGDATHPTFTAGLTRLHLYRFKVDPDPRAAARLAQLSPVELQRLWRRRALVHAVIRRWDSRLRWSTRPGWQLLSGWGGSRPWLVYPWAFSRKEGMESPELDLATFAEELLVPAEAVEPPDESARCRELSKSRFLDQRLQALEPSWKPERSCPRFEAWGDPEHLTGFDIAFTAPATGGAQSLFGHVLITLVRDDDAPDGDGQAMELAALVSPLEPGGLSYLAKGIFGGFQGIFALASLADVRHESLELEQRPLRRFRLQLDPVQRLRLLERMWDLQRNGYVAYRFFDANCASMLRFLISPVLDGDAPGNPNSPWETPVQLLDALGPKLALPRLDETSGQRARRAVALRRRLIAEAPAGVETLLPKLQALETLETSERIATYAALAAVVLAPSSEHWRGQVLLASLRIERCPFDLANLARLRAERSTVLPGWKGPTSEELIKTRRTLFEQEGSPMRRARKELGEQIALDELIQSAPRREPTSAEQKVIAADADAAERFDAVAAAVGGLPEAELNALLAEEALALKADQDEANARAVPESGYAQISLGAGLASGGIGFLRARPALLAEELGDQRLHGFGSRTEVHFFEGTIDLAFSPRASVQRGGLTLLAVRGLKENGWGWGGGIDYRYAGGAHEIATQVERLWAFVGDERLANFLLASAGLRLGVREQSGATGIAGAKVGLTARIQLPRSSGNAIHFDGEYAPRVGFDSSGARFEHRFDARARLTVRLGVFGPFAFSARADAELEWTVGSAPELIGVVGVQLD